MTKISTIASTIITNQSIAVGVGLFLILSTVGYIVFPMIFQGQINSNYSKIAVLESRVASLEAAMMRLDPEFNIIQSFAPDTLAIEADSLK